MTDSLNFDWSKSMDCIKRDIADHIDADDECSATVVSLTRVELDTVLAALRLFQSTPKDQLPPGLSEISTEHSATGLYSDEIDELCERLNTSQEEPAGSA